VLRKCTNSKVPAWISNDKVELDLPVSTEMERYQELNNNRKGVLLPNQVVLVVLNNLLLAARGFKTEL
jgi:hypothetical protein